MVKNNSNSGVLMTSFLFPAHIRTFAMEYLVYFSQFLADLNMEADVDIKEEADKIFLRVIPKNERVFAEQIREQLDIYLCAPDAPGLIKRLEDDVGIAGREWLWAIVHFSSRVDWAEPLISWRIASWISFNLSDYEAERLPGPHLTFQTARRGRVVTRSIFFVTGPLSEQRVKDLFKTLQILKRRC